MNSFPHELALGDVYFSPVLLVVILAFFLTSFTTLLLNRLRLSKFVYTPNLVFLAIMTLYILLIDNYWIQI